MATDCVRDDRELVALVVVHEDEGEQHRRSRDRRRPGGGRRRAGRPRRRPTRRSATTGGPPSGSRAAVPAGPAELGRRRRRASRTSRARRPPCREPRGERVSLRTHRRTAASIRVQRRLDWPTEISSPRRRARRVPRREGGRASDAPPPSRLQKTAATPIASQDVAREVERVARGARRPRAPGRTRRTASRPAPAYRLNSATSKNGSRRRTVLHPGQPVRGVDVREVELEPEVGLERDEAAEGDRVARGPGPRRDHEPRRRPRPGRRGTRPRAGELQASARTTRPVASARPAFSSGARNADRDERRGAPAARPADGLERRPEERRREQDVEPRLAEDRDRAARDEGPRSRGRRPRRLLASRRRRAKAPSTRRAFAAASPRTVSASMRLGGRRRLDPEERGTRAPRSRPGAAETQAVAPVPPSNGSLKPRPWASAAATLPGSAQSNIPGARCGRLRASAAAAITARPVQARSLGWPMGRQRRGGLTR